MIFLRQILTNKQEYRNLLLNLYNEKTILNWGFFYDAVQQFHYAFAGIIVV
jgi:hypothetical protein